MFVPDTFERGKDAIRTRRQVRTGQNGVLVPRDDAPALAGALRDAMRPNGLGQAGRARYLAEFAPAPVLAQWADTLGRMR